MRSTGAPRARVLRALALRVVAVAGFAGAAWLLGSAAGHADAHADPGASIVDSVAPPVVSLTGAAPTNAATTSTTTTSTTTTNAATTVAATATGTGRGTTAAQVHIGPRELARAHQPGASAVGHMPWLDAAPAADPRTAPAGGFGTPFLPDRPLAPLQAHQGGGATSAPGSAPGSGCTGDGGPNAVLGSSAAAGAADLRRLRAGSEGAVVRREPAAPTVSPD